MPPNSPVENFPPALSLVGNELLVLCAYFHIARDELFNESNHLLRDLESLRRGLRHLKVLCDRSRNLWQIQTSGGTIARLSCGD